MTLPISSWVPCSLPTLLLRENLGSSLLTDPHGSTTKVLAHFSWLPRRENGNLLESTTIQTPWLQKIVWATPLCPGSHWFSLHFSLKKSKKKKKIPKSFGNISRIHMGKGNWETQLISKHLNVCLNATWFLLIDKKCVIMKEHHNVYYAIYWLQWWLNFIKMHPVTHLFVRKESFCIYQGRLWT